MGVSEKAAYLRGLVEGSELGFNGPQQKVVDALLDLVQDMATAITDIDADVDVLFESVDDICDELDDIEEDLDYIFDEDEDEDYDDDDDDMLYDVECPNCHEVICVDEEVLLSGDIDCPNCGEKLEFEITECEGDCDACPAEDDFEDSVAKYVFSLMRQCAGKNALSVAAVLDLCADGALRGKIAEVLASGEFSQNTEQAVRDSVGLIRRNSLERQRRELLDRIQHFTVVTPQDAELMQRLLAQKMSVDAALKR